MNPLPHSSLDPYLPDLSFATGKHVLIAPRRNDATFYGVAWVDGQMRRMHANDSETLIRSFRERFGAPDTLHVFATYEAAKTAYPKFYL